MNFDAAMLLQCTHVNSQALGDILVRATDVEITDQVQGKGSSCSGSQARKQFVLDVMTVAMVDCNSTWGQAGARDGMLIQTYLAILVCWMLNKQNSKSMNLKFKLKLNPLTLDIVLWLLKKSHQCVLLIWSFGTICD